MELTIDEIHGLEQLIYNPELGNKEDFTREFGPLPLGRFVRSIVGLTEAAARQAFSEFINVPNIDPKQITFINTLIQSFTKNGIIEPAMLFEPPFTNLNENGVIGVFDDADAHKIISIIRQINHNADVG